MVFSKVGAAGLAMIASISARFLSMAASRAGLKSATLTLSKAGTPPCGPVHFASRGLVSAAMDRLGVRPAVTDAAAAVARKVRRFTEDLRWMGWNDPRAVGRERHMTRL